jgi:4-amino-4-deoxy-L-arabinose transferase-like glycosyltransferase
MGPQRERLATWIARLVDALRAPRPSAGLLFVLFLVALQPRLAFVEEHPPTYYLVSDMAIYRERAIRMLDGPTDVWDAFTPPGYPAFVALLFAIFGRDDGVVALAQAALGAGAVVLAYLAARRLGASPVAALVAFAMLAFYPPLVLYTGFFLTETLFSFLLALAFVLFASAAASRRDVLAAAAGLAFACGAAVRPNLLLAIPLLALVVFVRRDDPRLRRAAAIALVAAIPVLAAASIRASRLAGRPVLVATNGGVNFYLAHTDARGLRFPAGDAVREISTYTSRARAGPIEELTVHAHDDRAFFRLGVARVRAAPLAAAGRAIAAVCDGLGAGRVGGRENPPYWPGWMGHDDALVRWLRAMLALGTVPAIAHALLRIRAPDEASVPRLVALALVASVIVTLAMFLGNPRVRVSFDPLLIALAAAAWTDVAARIRRSRGGAAPPSGPPGSGSGR